MKGGGSDILEKCIYLQFVLVTFFLLVGLFGLNKYPKLPQINSWVKNQGYFVKLSLDSLLSS